MYKLKQIIGLVIFVGLALVLVALLAPPLAMDIAHRGDQLAPATDYRVQNASCRTYVFVVSFCEIDLAPTRATGMISQFSIVLGSTDGETVVPMKSTDGSYLTSSFAVDNLWNRLMAFVIAAVIVVAGMVRCVQRLRRGPPVTIAAGS